MALATPRTPTIIPTSPRSNRNLHGYQPLCFHKEVFSSPAFNVDAFIADCRKRVPLESVRTDLREYSSSLENELVELINKDYTDFVNLSSNLAGIDEVLNQLREPLINIKDEALEYKKHVETLIEYTLGKKKEKHSAIGLKKYLGLLIATSDSVDKLESLLSCSSQQPPEMSPLDLAVYIDRIGNEYNLLRFFLTYATQNFSSVQGFVDKFSPKITALASSLEKEVSKHFRAAILHNIKGTVDPKEQLQQGHPSVLPGNNSGSSNKVVPGSCLRVYSALNKVSSAYDIYREVVIKPNVLQIITTANLEKGSRGTCEGLKAIFDALLAFISRTCCPFLADVREVVGDKYDFLSNSIWVEIEETMNTRIGRIYNPGIPEIFLQNYKASFVFLSKLEGIGCNTIEELCSFRAHPVYAKFEKCWNTSVYRQLRFTEIASKVEVALSQLQQQVTTQPAIQDSSFQLLGSSILWQELNRIWSNNIFIFELTSQFVKLTLQLLSRYSSWIAASYTQTINKPTELTSISNDGTVVAGNAFDEQAAAIWNKLVPGVYAFIYHDLVTLATNLQGPFQKQMQSVLKQEGALPPQPLLDKLSNTISSAAAALLVHKSPIEMCITTNLTKKAIDGLEPLLGVTATYRHTDKRAPTRANYYVDDVVSVLENFTKSLANVISFSVIKEWELKVLEDVTLKYEGLIAKTLNDVYKTEATLSRMVKKNRQTATSGLSDIDKISLQLFLDVTKYGELLKTKLNIEANSFPPYCNLLARVNDGAKFKDIISSGSV
eukprot:Phypoly_transcript_01488.p1 GENE.Phypoly_transcript_01488~~Phypoly_transcript_01488.p1  ORF type:complete len:776 (+),score=90.88 Phypoly_transcript_01488:957-3284(+)